MSTKVDVLKIEETAMNLISNNSAFVILLLMGVIVVGINAVTQFRVPVPNTNAGSFETLLDGLPMQVLAVRQKYSMGFMLYLFIIEVIYLMLSSSTVLLQAFMQFTGNTSSIGALAIDHSEINPYIPILASSVVVTASQLKPFNVVEHFIRRVSHRIVGSSFEIEIMASDIEQGSFPSMPQSEKDSNGMVPIEEIIAKACDESGWTEVQIKHFCNLRSDIRFLDAWTNGDRSKVFNSLSRFDSIVNLKTVIDSQVDSFHDRLWRAVNSDASEIDQWSLALNRAQKPLFKAEDFWAIAMEEAERTKHNLSILLALLLANKQDVVAAIKEDDVRHFFAGVLRPADSTGKYSIIATGATWGTVVCFVVFYAYHLTISAVLDVTSSYTSNVSPSKVYLQSFQSKQLVSQKKPLAENTDSEIGLLGNGGAQVDESDSMTDKSMTVYRLDVWQYFARVSSKSVVQSFWDACIYGAMFLMAGAVSVAACSSRLPMSGWRRWSRGNLPFWQYMTVGAVASLLTFFVYSILLFARLVVLPSIELENTVLSVTLLADFKNHFANGSGVPLMAFAVACCICYVHDKLSIDAASDNDVSAASNLTSANDPGNAFSRGEMVQKQYATRLYRCRVFSGFLEKRDPGDTNIGATIVMFSLIVAAINMLVMLNAGIVGSPKQFLNAFFLPGLAFFIIVSIFFELMTINSEAKPVIAQGDNLLQPAQNGDDRARRVRSTTGSQVNEDIETA